MMHFGKSWRNEDGRASVCIDHCRIRERNPDRAMDRSLDSVAAKIRDLESSLSG